MINLKSRLHNSNTLDAVLLLMVAVFWGSSYGVAKNAVMFYPVLGFIAIRFCITFILFLPLVFKLNKNQIFTTLKVGLPLGIILLAIFISETYGLSKTKASNSAFLISLYIVFTPLIQWLILKERPSRKIVAASLIALIGVFLLSYNKYSFSLNSGDILILLAAALRGLMVTATKKMAKSADINNIFLTTVQTGVVGIGCLVIAVFVLPLSALTTLPANGRFWTDVIYLVIFCTMFAFFVQNFSVRRTSPTKVSLLMGTEPLWGAVYAVFCMGETLTLSACLGGALIVIASLFAIRK